MSLPCTASFFILLTAETINVLKSQHEHYTAIAIHNWIRTQRWALLCLCMPTVMMLSIRSQGERICGLREFKTLVLFKVHFVCCSVFILCIGLSHTYTFPTLFWQAQIAFLLSFLSSSCGDSLYFSLSFRKPSSLNCLPVLGDVGVHSNSQSSSFSLPFIAQQRMQTPATNISVNAMSSRSFFRPRKWLI